MIRFNFKQRLVVVKWKGGYYSLQMHGEVDEVLFNNNYRVKLIKGVYINYRFLPKMDFVILQYHDF